MSDDMQRIHKELRELALKYDVRVETQQRRNAEPTFTREEFADFVRNIDTGPRAINIVCVRPRGPRLTPITAENQEVTPRLGLAYVRSVKP